MILAHLIAITLAYGLDWLIGDPIDWPHPVKWMGALIAKLEQTLNKGAQRKYKGILLLLIVLSIVGGVATILTILAYQVSFLTGISVEAILLWSTIAQRGLKEAALSVYVPLQERNITEARQKLSYIVGRDTKQLEEEGIVRATVETVAENTSDGVTAPLFWALIGGAPLALVYRATNTCDSMVGYKNERYAEFGWASARFDDVLNYVPARLTAICMLLSNRSSHSKRLNAAKIVLRNAPKHPSPNSGWGEAAVAALLGIQLGGINYYKGIRSDRAKMGEPNLPINPTHILAVNQILIRTVLTFILLQWAGGMLIELAFTRS